MKMHPNHNTTNRHGLMRHLIKAHSKPGGEQCLYCPFRYNDILVHIDNVHADKKACIDDQVCRKCVPVQKFHDFHDLLKHTKSYHRKKPLVSTSSSTSPKKSLKVKKLCENCGKLVKHKSTECPKILEDQEVVLDQDPEKKKYVPVHLSGTCPYCEYKFADLLGHIRHNHAAEKTSAKANTCPLCSETFGSVRELVSHRQLHPQFKQHSCSKCSLEFETVVELRNHRAKLCAKSKKAKKILALEDSTLPVTVQNQPMLSTLMMMANNIDVDDQAQAPMNQNVKAKQVDYEGRGSVACHLCKKSFILKTLLKRHYVTAHNYDPNKKPRDTGNDVIQSDGNVNKETSMAGNANKERCEDCNKTFQDANEAIKHHLDMHALVSGLICPYCDCKYGSKKFDDLDSHVEKYHVLEMQSPVQTCGTCKVNFNTYEALKVHRQIHEGGNRPRILVDVTSGEALASATIAVHPRVGAKPEISNRGGLKCQLCNAFKLRKDHLKLHYIRYHGYDPKAALPKKQAESANLNIDETSMQGDLEASKLECPSCHSMFDNNHFLIKHLLKIHCVYSGLICPYCRGHFPSRFIDLQSHVTAHHMDQLTGYNICNRCKVCQKQFSGYAELRDHVQLHGDGYKDALITQTTRRQQQLQKRPKVNTAPAILRRHRTTKILVPVATDSSGQLRLSSEALQKAILLATRGGQIENIPHEGLVIGNNSSFQDDDESDAEGPLAGILDYK